MCEEYLSLLRDPDDAPIFSEVYERYQKSVQAAVLQRLDPRCDANDTISLIWSEEARQFHETKEWLLESRYDAYRVWIFTFSMFIVIREKNAKFLAEAEETDPEQAVDEAE